MEEPSGGDSSSVFPLQSPPMAVGILSVLMFSISPPPPFVTHMGTLFIVGFRSRRSHRDEVRRHRSHEGETSMPHAARESDRVGASHLQPVVGVTPVHGDGKMWSIYSFGYHATSGDDLNNNGSHRYDGSLGAGVSGGEPNSPRFSGFDHGRCNLFVAVNRWAMVGSCRDALGVVPESQAASNDGLSCQSDLGGGSMQGRPAPLRLICWWPWTVGHVGLAVCARGCCSFLASPCGVGMWFATYWEVKTLPTWLAGTDGSDTLVRCFLLEGGVREVLPLLRVGTSGGNPKSDSGWDECGASESHSYWGLVGCSVCWRNQWEGLEVLGVGDLLCILVRLLTDMHMQLHAWWASSGNLAVTSVDVVVEAFLNTTTS
jgi:hypothetical protein